MLPLTMDLPQQQRSVIVESESVALRGGMQGMGHSLKLGYSSVLSEQYFSHRADVLSLPRHSKLLNCVASL